MEQSGMHPQGAFSILSTIFGRFWFISGHEVSKNAVKKQKYLYINNILTYIN